jgi:type VI secretion system secreted protein Hcp
LEGRLILARLAYSRRGAADLAACRFTSCGKSVLVSHMKWFRFRWQGLIAVILGSFLLSAHQSFAAVEMFLKLSDAQGNILIEGESEDGTHAKEILIASFSQGVVVPSAPTLGGGSGEGKATFSSLNLTKLLDKASPLLYSYAAQGRSIPKAILTLRKVFKEPTDFYVITLAEVTIASVQTAGGGDVPTESFSLNFARIEWRYVPQKPDGAAGTAIVTTWDLRTSAQ